MALKSCKECGSKISTSAKVCPSCGKPQTTTTKKVALWIWVGAFGLFAIAIMSADKTPPKTAASEDAQKASAPEKSNRLAGDNLTTESWQTKSAAIACNKSEYMDKLSSFAAARDKEAF